MEVRLNSISGIDDAIVSMFISKRSLTKELEDEIRYTCDDVLNRRGFIKPHAKEEDVQKLNDWIDLSCKWGHKHITLLRYIDFSVTVEGLHRGGTDDFDSHAKRLENRIIRSSTRLSKFGYEMSDYYKGKIIPTDLALQDVGIEVPEVIYTDPSGKTFSDDMIKSWDIGVEDDTYEICGKHGEVLSLKAVKYVKTVNGYIREDLKDNKDVERGLYMLSIPSSFEFKVNLTEYAHIYKLRGEMGGAHRELKDMIESLTDKIEGQFHQFNRELLMKIEN